ncbi:MAG: NAD(P)-dependent oxidoreductase [Thermodesulfobacteriota bacterium]
MKSNFNITIEKDYSRKAPGFREQISRLKNQAGFTLRFLEVPGKEMTGAVSPEELKDADVYILMGKRRIAKSSLEGLTRLKWIGRFGAGFETVDIDACNRKGILLSNSPHGIREPVAELVMGYIFALATRLPFFDRYIREHGFAGKNQYGTMCVNGMTLGLIGCGGIARALVRLAAPLEMKIRAYDPYADKAALRAKGIEPCDLETLLKAADFCSVHVPLTPETRGLLQEAHFRMMKPTAYFINTSRGGIYPDALLARALAEGWIAGAAVDVFEDEPDVGGNPLLSCERAILTPHVAGAMNNLDSIRMVMEPLVDSIFNIAEGALPDNIINPEASSRPVPREKLTPSFNPNKAGPC